MSVDNRKREVMGFISEYSKPMNILSFLVLSTHKPHVGTLEHYDVSLSKKTNSRNSSSLLGAGKHVFIGYVFSIQGKD
jgi:hypothetical protein